MGVYTGLAKLGTKKWESRRYLGSGPAREEGQDRPIEETRFVCAECRQYFPFDEECPRCGQAVVDRTVALPAARRELRRSLLGRPFSGSPLFYVFVVGTLAQPLVWIPLVEYFEGQPTGGVLTAIGGAVASMLLAPTIYGTVRRLREHWGRARLRGDARAASERLACIPLADAPGETDEPIRVRGRVRFDVDETSVRARICDDTGSALIAERAHIHARSASGVLEELDSVRAGDLVEIVATGRRHARAGETYREGESELELGAEAPLEVWVLERAGG